MQDFAHSLYKTNYRKIQYVLFQEAAAKLIKLY
jgi:hypothetical protein